MFRSYASVRLENLALRRQVVVYKQSLPRPKLKPADRMFWAWLSRLWPGWQRALEFGVRLELILKVEAAEIKGDDGCTVFNT